MSFFIYLIDLATIYRVIFNLYINFRNHFVNEKNESLSKVYKELPSIGGVLCIAVFHDSIASCLFLSI